VLACAAAVLVAGCGGQQARAEVRYLALGDSFTQGVGTSDERTEAFPAVLAQRWRANGCDVELENAGISGDTSGQVLVKQAPEIESFRPTVVTFQAGANDIAREVSLDEYRRNVKSVLDAATTIGARIIVIGQNEWFRTPTGRRLGRDLGLKRDAYDGELKAETSAHGG
jgi:lysophospholipase L1-like esterase